MAKLKLIPDPTFHRKVGIPLPSGEKEEMSFEFKHRTRTALLEWLQSLDGKTDWEIFSEHVVSWNFDAPFNEDSLKTLSDNRQGALKAIFNGYVDGLMDARVGN